jgi:hypothetical protein
MHFLIWTHDCFGWIDALLMGLLGLLWKQFFSVPSWLQVFASSWNLISWAAALPSALP